QRARFERVFVANQTCNLGVTFGKRRVTGRHGARRLAPEKPRGSSESIPTAAHTSPPTYRFRGRGPENKRDNGPENKRDRQPRIRAPTRTRRRCRLAGRPVRGALTLEPTLLDCRWGSTKIRRLDFM